MPKVPNRKYIFAVVVHENHRDLLLCLRFKNLFNCEPTEIQTYRFTRLIFGASSLPFLLNATIKKHGQSYEKIDEELARIVRSKFYVDVDVEEGLDLYEKMKFRLDEASFVIILRSQIDVPMPPSPPPPLNFF